MNRIKELRERNSISAQALASQLGWGGSRVRNYENKFRKPGLEESREIVWALNVLGVKCTLDTVFPPEAETKRSKKS